MVAKLDSKRVNGKASYQPIQEELNDNPYNNGWVIDIVIRRIKIKGVHIVFDIEEWYEDTHDNAESRGTWEEQEISDILNSCDKEKVEGVLLDISNTYLTNGQLIALNR